MLYFVFKQKTAYEIAVSCLTSSFYGLSTVNSRPGCPLHRRWRHSRSRSVMLRFPGFVRFEAPAPPPDDHDNERQDRHKQPRGVQRAEPLGPCTEIKNCSHRAALRA